MTSRIALNLALTLGFTSLLPAAIIGTNPPAEPLTAQRIAKLPTDRQPVWKEYLERSERQLRANRTFFFQEMKQHNVNESLIPPKDDSASCLSLREPAPWYGQAEARRIADIVISFQTPAGGWTKNLDMTRHRRAPGEYFASDNKSLRLSALDYDLPRDASWNYTGTFDNDATCTELRYLAKVISAVGPKEDSPYRAAFLRGMDYIFAAQFPNGGWPQVWPLQGGYHDAITYNDDAVLNVLELLNDVAEGRNEFAFAPRETRKLAATRLARGIQCVLDTQIVVEGRRTVWCQQHDPLTLQPASARNYEMPAQCGSESADVVRFLMRLPNPNAKTVAAVHAAAEWFEKTKVPDVAFKPVGDEGNQLVPAPGAGFLWARYYEIGSDRPVFGDRDKTIHDNLSEISKERRNGYRWFSNRPERALQAYAGWKATHPKPAAHSD